VADAGIGKIEAGAPAGNDASDKTEFISGSLMNNGNSRIGVRGVEDLGGGLKAGFNFESGLDLDNGNNLGSGGGFWGRAANLWLGGNWGTFKMGRTLNPSFYGVATWELTGAANYSVVANTFSVAGSGARNSSQFSYKTPDGLGGFSAELGYVMKPDNGGNAKWDANVIYANGPIGVGLSANKVKGQKTGFALGAKYNFGSFALAGSYNDAHGVRKGVSLGGSAMFGPFTLTADVTRDTKNAAGKKYTNFLLEGKYALSKRTFVYLAGLRLDSTNNYGLGVRHNF
nr:porin [Ottowia sp.]